MGLHRLAIQADYLPMEPAVTQPRLIVDHYCPPRVVTIHADRGTGRARATCPLCRSYSPRVRMFCLVCRVRGPGLRDTPWQVGVLLDSYISPITVHIG